MLSWQHWLFDYKKLQQNPCDTSVSRNVYQTKPILSEFCLNVGYVLNAQ